MAAGGPPGPPDVAEDGAAILEPPEPHESGDEHSAEDGEERSAEVDAEPPPTLFWTKEELASLLAQWSPEEQSELGTWSREKLAQALFAAFDTSKRGRLRCAELQPLWSSDEGNESEWSTLYSYICSELGTRPEDGVDEGRFLQLLDGKWTSDEEVYDPNGDILKKYLVEADIALVRLSYLRSCAAKDAADCPGSDRSRLQARHELPKHALVFGEQLEQTVFDVGGIHPRGPDALQVFVVSHAWLSEEHPDPHGLRLRELVATLDRLGAPEEALVFVDFSSLHQSQAEAFSRAVSGGLPDLGELMAQRAMSTPAAASNALVRAFSSRSSNGTLGTPTSLGRSQHMRLALAGLDKLFASRAANVVILSKILSGTGGADSTYNFNARSYTNRGWCLIELSVASFFGRIVNLNEAPVLPEVREPAILERMARSGQLAFTVRSDAEPALAMYKRYYYSLTRKQVLRVIEDREIENHHEMIQYALGTVNIRFQRELVASLGQAHSLRWFSADVVRLLFEPLVAPDVAAALAGARGDEGAIREFSKSLESRDWRTRAAAVLALDILDPQDSERSIAARRDCQGCFHCDTHGGWHDDAAGRWRSCADVTRAAGIASSKGGTRAVALFVALAEHAHDGVREAAAEALGRVAPVGCEEAEDVLCSLMMSISWRTKVAAICALDIVDPRDDKAARRLRRACYQHLALKSWEPASAVERLETLSETAEPGDQRTLLFLTGMLLVSDEHVQRVAARAAYRLARPGDETIAAAFGTLVCGAETPLVRLTAAELLPVVARRGDILCATALAKLVAEDPEWTVRGKAVVGLGSLATRGDETSWVCLQTCLATDEKAYVRADAARAMSGLCSRGDEGLTAVLCERIGLEADELVQATLLDLLALQAARGDEAAVEAACRVALDRSARPQDASSSSSSSCCAGFAGGPSAGGVGVGAVVGGGERGFERGDSSSSSSEFNGFGLVEPVVDRGDFGLGPGVPTAAWASPTSAETRATLVPVAAARAIAASASKGDRLATEALVALLSDGITDVRREAVRGLIRVAAKGDKFVAASLALRLEDEDFSVRYFATKALGELFDRGDQVVKVGQRVEVTGYVTGRHRGKKGMVARLADEGHISVVLDSGDLVVLHERDLLVLSEGTVAALNDRLSDSHLAVRKAALLALSQRRKAGVAEQGLMSLSTSPQKATFIDPLSGRTPPCLRRAPGKKKESIGPLSARGTPTYRYEFSTTVWKPVTPVPRCLAPRQHLYCPQELVMQMQIAAATMDDEEKDAVMADEVPQRPHTAAAQLESTALPRLPAKPRTPQPSAGRRPGAAAAAGGGGGSRLRAATAYGRPHTAQA